MGRFIFTVTWERMPQRSIIFAQAVIKIFRLALRILWRGLGIMGVVPRTDGTGTAHAGSVDKLKPVGLAQVVHRLRP